MKSHAAPISAVLATAAIAPANAVSAVARPATVAASALSLCHFSTLQTSLKSRSFHMQCRPLADSGVSIRYVSPVRASATAPADGPAACAHIEFIAAKRPATPLRRLLPSFSLLRTLLRQRATLYHFQEPELLPLALVLKLAFRKRVLYDAYEDFPSMMREKRRIPRRLRPIAARLIAAAERAAALCFDGIITADPSTMCRFARTRRSRKLVFYNFPNLDFFPPPSAASAAAAVAHQKFDLIYRGGISKRTGVSHLLEALQVLAQQGRRVTLLLIGYFDCQPAEQHFRARIRALNLESQIEIRPRIEHHHMATALAEARIGISPLDAIPKFLLNIPVKVFEYWACGLPVISSDLPPIRPFFRVARAGLLFRPGDSADLATCIRWMLDHPQMAAAMGSRGREAIIQRFNNQSESHKLRRFCQRITLCS